MISNKNHLAVLKRAYVDNDFPSDRIRARREHLDCFARVVNERASSAYDSDVIGDTLIHLRKRGQLPRIGRTWSGPKFEPKDN